MGNNTYDSKSLIKADTDISENEHRNQLFNIPTGQQFHFIDEVLSSAEDLENLPFRKKLVSKGTKYKVQKSGDKRKVSCVKGNKVLEVEIADITAFTGKRSTAIKLKDFALVKANEQILSKGSLVGDSIKFPLQELVDIGIYKNIRSARAGFKNGAGALEGIKVKATHNKDKDYARAVLFTGDSVENSQCTLIFNSNINWKTFIQGFTIMPYYYFELSNRAGTLLREILYLARQNGESLNDKGYFTVSMRKVHQTLNLPIERGNKNPNRDIKEPIKKAISEIKETHRDALGNDDLEIIPVYEDSWNIKQFLDDGYLKITLKGEFEEQFKAIGSKKTRLKEQKKIDEK